MLAYTPAYPETAPAAVEAMPIRPFDTQAGIGYSLRNLSITLDNAAIAGIADNVLGVEGQFRTGSWLLGMSAWRLKVPVNATVLSEISNPALEPEISEIRARAGYVVGLAALAVGDLPVGLAIAPGIALVSQQADPGGSGLPVTGTPLDFAQTRRGLGLEVPAILALGDAAELQLRAGYFPATGARLDKAPYGFKRDNLDLIEGYAGLRLKLTGGLDAEIGAGLINWVGAVPLDGTDREFKDLASTFTAGLVYRPERVGP